MELALIQFKDYVASLYKNGDKVDKVLLDEFGEKVKNEVSRFFTRPQGKSKSISMSQLGKPLCQLWYRLNKPEAAEVEWNLALRLMYGYLVEQLIVFLFKSAKIYFDEGDLVSITVNSTKINGKYDLLYNKEVWDIKSASPYSFMKMGSFKSLEAEDTFGYITQGLLYEAGAKKPFRGWIIIDKVSGDVEILRVPTTIDKKKYAREIERKLNLIAQNFSFQRGFELVKNKKTNKLQLCKECKFCEYKRDCWGENLIYDTETKTWTMKEGE